MLSFLASLVISSAHAQIALPPKVELPAASPVPAPLSHAPKSLPAKTAAAKNDPETKRVLDETLARYKRLRNWKAEFSQETFSVGLGKGSFGEGQLLFEAPNRFFYSLKFPEASDFISNGKEVWQVIFRKGRDKPAFVRHFSSLSDMNVEKYLLILRGIDANKKGSDPLADFNVRGAKEKEGASFLELVPKDSSDGIARIVLHFREGRDAPEKAVLTDSLGNTTTIVIKSFEPLRTAAPANAFKPVFAKDSEVQEF